MNELNIHIVLKCVNKQQNNIFTSIVSIVFVKNLFTRNWVLHKKKKRKKKRKCEMIIPLNLPNVYAVHYFLHISLIQCKKKIAFLKTKNDEINLVYGHFLQCLCSLKSICFAFISFRIQDNWIQRLVKEITKYCHCDG